MSIDWEAAGTNYMTMFGSLLDQETVEDAIDAHGGIEEAYEAEAISLGERDACYMASNL